MRTTMLTLLFVIAGFGSIARGDEAVLARQWIVVSPVKFTTAITPLAERRAEDGWTATRIEFKDSENAADVRTRIATAVEGFEGTSVVLLVGEHGADGLPTFEGRHGRMAGQPTDHPYGLPNDFEVASFPVGRLPARNVEEARSMVARTLAFEDRSPSLELHRIHLMIGDPGAQSKLEERFARVLVGNMAETRLGMLHPMWRPVCIADTPGTRFSLPGETFDEAAKSLIAGEQILVGYAGHSGAAGLWSPGRRTYNLDREAFEKLDTGRHPGMLVSCGCFGCQVEGAGGIGYVLAAMRNPTGPAAGIGAFGESYAAFGQLALDGVVDQLTTDDPPRTLGEYWLAAQHGIVRGKMNTFQFFLYDRADGSGGKVPLADQRLEHAEMWTLFGDPALRLPFLRPILPVAVDGEAVAGGTLTVTIDLPEDATTETIDVLVEPRQLRWSDVSGPGAGPLATVTAKVADHRAKASLTLPETFPEGDLVVRAVATDRLYGVAVVTPPPPPAEPNAD